MTELDIETPSEWRGRQVPAAIEPVARRRRRAITPKRKKPAPPSIQHTIGAGAIPRADRIRQPLAKDKDRERQPENRERELDIETPSEWRRRQVPAAIDPVARRGRAVASGSGECVRYQLRSADALRLPLQSSSASRLTAGAAVDLSSLSRMCVPLLAAIPA